MHTTTAAPRPSVAPTRAARTSSRTRPAVVVNTAKLPTVSAREAFRSRVSRALRAHGCGDPLWMETTEQSQGTVEARCALAAQADLVLVAGGDGTVRRVAQELCGTGTPIALIPFGTGNLLARNLGIPCGDTEAAVRCAVEGHDRSIDVGRLEIDREGHGDFEERWAFLVMAGAGFDAATMARAGAASKRRLGAAAYVLSGARALCDRPVSATLTADGRDVCTGTGHGVVIGNLGRIGARTALFPAAEPDDGLLDAVAVRPGSPWQWAEAAAAVLRGRESPSLPRVQGSVVGFRTDIPVPVEVDGDVIGRALGLRATVRRAGLAVRTPGRT